jgi:hypothetical protein
MSHVRLNSAADATLTARSFDHPDSAWLLRDYAEERREIVGFDDPPDLDKPVEYQAPWGLFVVAYTQAGDPIGCGGVRAYPDRDRVVEIRKMYVAPQHRDQPPTTDRPHRHRPGTPPPRTRPPQTDRIDPHLLKPENAGALHRGRR